MLAELFADVIRAWVAEPDHEQKEEAADGDRGGAGRQPVLFQQRSGAVAARRRRQDAAGDEEDSADRSPEQHRHKRDTNDVRESPALHVLEGLRKKGASIYFADPHVSSISIAGQTIKPVELTADLLQSMDCVAVLTDHSSFDYSMIAQHSSLIFDTRNAFKDFPSANSVLL